jgi:hypothetical protein
MRHSLVVLTVALVCVGCAAPGAQVSAVPSTSARASVSAATETGSPSPMESLAPTRAPSPPASAPDGRADVAEVVTTDLVMRSEPGVGPDSQIYDPPLSAPVLLYILDGPVVADGYEWFRVVPFDDPHTDIGRGGPGLGWVAAGGKDGEAWIAPWTGACPAETAEDIMWRSQFVALACFGDREPTLEGTLDCLDSSTSDAPAEFKVLCFLVPFGAPPGRLLRGFAFYPESATPEGEQGVAVRVTGHYDDPAALTCAEHTDVGLERPAELEVLVCRGKFVATGIAPTSAP